MRLRKIIQNKGKSEFLLASHGKTQKILKNYLPTVVTSKFPFSPFCINILRIIAFYCDLMFMNVNIHSKLLWAWWL